MLQPSRSYLWEQAGGGRWESLFGGDLATVEVLDTTTKKWLSASPLPVVCSEMTSALLIKNCWGH